MAEVARLVGYADPVVFTRMFKRRTGTTPRAWRKTVGDGATNGEAEG